MNKIFDFLTSSRALMVYAVLSLSIIILNSPSCQIKLNHILADLTQEAVVNQLNPMRTGQGYSGLKVSLKLSQAAQMKAEDMIKRGYFSHIGPNGEEPWIWLEKVGYNYAAAGENLAVNYFDAESLIGAWLESPDHAKNMLNGYFTDIGVGISKGDIFGKGESVVAVMFLGREITPILAASVANSDLTADNKYEDVKNTAPEKPVVKKTVNDNVLETNPRNIQKIERDYAGYVNTKIFLANFLTYEFRLGITFFFTILIVWIFVMMSVRKERFFSIKLLRPALLALFIFIIWFPIINIAI
ncbi:MAG: CAP domain-containing protein [bacterium]|nr:CAP domain-containing protein [bacterium]